MQANGDLAGLPEARSAPPKSENRFSDKARATNTELLAVLPAIVRPEKASRP
ncbi:hypothetical protein PSE_0513 [Pseudovibrio sp. FO-BEG1]|nr:hypothetical protein PSE_0513 [Pseudovibrio sp. FO-BEG1]EEA95472.1 hypothetical protein PJE062_3043 [Pseudovibrio sp. JE062]